MPVTLNDFVRHAQNTRFDSRDVIVDDTQAPKSVKYGMLLFSSGSKMNQATMNAFKEALEHDYGVFGLHAFDTVVGTRAQLHKSLRACDIKSVFSHMEALKMKRLANEEARQLETDPVFLELNPAIRSKVRVIITSQWTGTDHDQSPQHAQELSECHSQDDIAKLANKIIKDAIVQAKQELRNQQTETIQPSSGDKSQPKADTPSQPQTDTPSKPKEPLPLGLSRLDAGISYGKQETSVENGVQKGWVGAGMRLNFGNTLRPAVFEKLKTNGVEPGFIYHNDWSREDTGALKTNIHSREIKDAIENIINSSPTLKQTASSRQMSYIEKGLLVGRAHPAGIAFATEYVLSKELDKLEANSQASSPLINAL